MRKSYVRVIPYCGDMVVLAYTRYHVARRINSPGLIGGRVERSDDGYDPFTAAHRELHEEVAGGMVGRPYRLHFLGTTVESDASDPRGGQPRHTYVYAAEFSDGVVFRALAASFRERADNLRRRYGLHGARRFLEVVCLRTVKARTAGLIIDKYHAGAFSLFADHLDRHERPASAAASASVPVPVPIAA